ncbi:MULTISPECIES: hypothetical protein [unclassified Bradyrhizobium]
MGKTDHQSPTQAGTRDIGLLAQMRTAQHRRLERATIASHLGREEALSPFRAAAIFAAIRHYVADPKGIVAAATSGSDHPPAGSPLAHALRAQSLAAAGDHHGAASTMAAALRAIAKREAQPGITAGEGRHYRLLLALGGTFLHKQAHLAGLNAVECWPDICKEDFGARAVEAFPLESYLQLERHEQLCRERRFDQALPALMQWLAIAARSPEETSYAAIQAAVVALGIQPTEPGRDAFIIAAERLLEKGLAPGEPDQKEIARNGQEQAARDARARLAYWLGRVRLVKAEIRPDAPPRAVEAFEVARKTSDAREADIAKGWLPEARRVDAFHVFSKSRRGPLNLLDAFLSEVDAARLRPVYSSDAMISPRPRLRRFVLDIPTELLGDKPDEIASAISGEGAAAETRGTIAELRSRWWRRYRFRLPGGQWRKTDGPMRVLIDGQPIGTFVVASTKDVADQLDEALRFHLHKLVEPDMASDLGVEDFKETSWMPLVRLLLSEQTSLRAREALRKAVNSIETQGTTVIEAAGRYRLDPAVRPLLWGAKHAHMQLDDVLPQAEDRLLACTGTDQMLVVPNELSEDIITAIKKRNELGPTPDSFSGTIRPAGTVAAEQGVREATQHSTYSAVERAIVVKHQRIRPWLRILIAQDPLLLKMPVLTEEEVAA